MVDRNAKVKPAPERWHDERERFNLVISFDRLAYESIIDGMRVQHQRGMEKDQEIGGDI
jgi:hypothetical protein